MERYSLNRLKELLKFNFEDLELNAFGLDKELVTNFYFDTDELFKNKFPLQILCCGITYPDPKYKINRINSRIYVLEYIVSGKGYIEIDDKIITVKKGDIYLIEPYKKHRYYADKDDPFKKLWVNFYSPTYGDILKSFKMNGIYHFPNVDCQNYFYQLFLLENISSYSEDISYDAYGIIFKMTLKIKESIDNNSKEKTDIAIQIRQIIDQHINRKISIDDIANRLKLSKTTVINKFKEYYKITPKQYALDKRIKMACILLLDTDKKINEIASELSFSDAYNFSHTFKKLIGISPIEYRNQNFELLKKETK